jgi:hypothetical protein
MRPYSLSHFFTGVTFLTGDPAIFHDQDSVISVMRETKCELFHPKKRNNECKILPTKVHE